MRSATELCGVNRNTAILYFYKLRELIADHLVADAPDLMAGEIEVDESHFFLVVPEKESVAVVQRAKFPYLGCSSVVLMSTRSPSQIPAQKRFSLSLKAKYDLTALSTRTASRPMMSSTYPTSTMLGSTIQNSLPRIAITSPGLRISGTRPNVIFAGTMAYPGNTSTSISRSVSGASTTGLQAIC